MINHPIGNKKDTLASSSSSFNGVSTRSINQGSLSREAKPLSSHFFESPREEPSNAFRFDLQTRPFDVKSARENIETISPFIVNPSQMEESSPQTFYDRFIRRKDTHYSTLINRDFFLTRFKKTESDPKIVITPVNEELQKLNVDTFSPRLSVARTSPYSPKKMGIKKQVSEFVFRRFVKTEVDSEKTMPINIVEDPLKRKAVFYAKIRPSRNTPGRLLHIMAKQAVSGRNTEVSKTFLAALEKTNQDVLRRARKELYLNRRKRIKRFLRNIKKSFYEALNPWMPDNLMVVLWRVLILFNILAQLCFSNYIICFHPMSKSNFENPLYIVDFILDLLYLLEIITRFQIGYYYHGELRIERGEIMGHYLTTTFIWDFISMFSLIGRFFPESHWQKLILLTNVRIYKLWPLMASIEDFFQFSKEVLATLRVVKLTVFICLFAHYCACLLYVITLIEDYDENWISMANLLHKQEVELYVVSLYWSVTIMATVGFGDIFPTTLLERIALVAIMIFTSIIFGYILSTIGSLIMEASAYSTEARHKIRILTKYMSEKGLNKNAQSKIRKYLEFFLDRENAAKLEGDGIMKMLSPNLQEEIVREVNAKILSDSRVFSANYRRKFLYLASKDLIERSFGPEETLFYCYEETDLSIYFITSGKVDLCYERCGTSLQKIKKGEACGLHSFFSGAPRTITAKSVEFTTVFQLPREKFLEKLGLFPTEKETYYMMKDSLNLYNNSQYLNIKCYSCGSVEHEVIRCPNLHVIVDRAEVIKEYLAEEVKFRKTFVRKNKTRFHTLKGLDQLSEAASQIQMGHQTEVHYTMENLDDDVGALGSYSSIDEVLDRRIYDPRPLDYVEDTTHMKYLDLAGAFRQQSIGTLVQLPGSKRIRQRVGEIESFMRNNYDPYFHNLNIDRVKNFEVYFPNNNISRLAIEFEKVRLEKIVTMRLGVKAKHISTFLVKGLKMNEIKNTSTNIEAIPIARAPSIKNPKIIKRKEKNDLERKDSNSSNPGDIINYSKVSNVKRPSQYKLLSKKTNPANPSTNSSLLPSPYDARKGDSFEAMLNKIGKSSKDYDLSVVQENSYERMPVNSRSRLSLESPGSWIPSRLIPSQTQTNVNKKLNSSIEFLSISPSIRSPDYGNSPTNGLHSTTYRNVKTEIIISEVRDNDYHPEESHNGNETSNDYQENTVEAERTQGFNGTVDYSKLLQRFTEKLGENSRTQLNTKMTLKTECLEKDASETGEKTLPDCKGSDGSQKMFQVLLQERGRGHETERKPRASSEARGKDIMEFMEKNNLPQVFKKLTSIDDE